MTKPEPVPPDRPAPHGLDLTARLDEQLLVERVRAGDPLAFEAIFRRYHREPCDVAQGVVSNYTSAVFGGSAYGPDHFAVGQPRMGVPFRDAPERYLANSPVRFLEQVTTPLLLTHGVDDGTVTVSQSEEIFRGLAQLGKPVELVLYHKAGHDMEDAWWQRALDWFDRFLK